MKVTIAPSKPTPVATAEAIANKLTAEIQLHGISYMLGMHNMVLDGKRYSGTISADGDDVTYTISSQASA